MCRIYVHNSEIATYFASVDDRVTFFVPSIPNQ